MKPVKYQRGVSLTDLIAWGAVIIFVIFIAVKVMPSVTEAYQIKRAVASTASKVQPGDTPTSIRQIYNNQAVIDGIRKVYGDTLEVRKKGSLTILAYDYEDKIPLFANVSLAIHYQGEQTIGAGRSRE